METRKPSMPESQRPAKFTEDEPKQAGWWSDFRATGWDRVKAAFRRDWEQTKADFSHDAGYDLHQDATDTVKQATGSAPVPPFTEKTRGATVKEAAKARVKAFEKNKKADQKIGKAYQDIAKEEAKLEDEKGKADARAEKAIAKHEDKIDEAKADADRANDAWLQAEREASFGYAARFHYPQFEAWNDDLETALHGDWDETAMGASWENARAGIRRGWEYGKPPLH